MPFAVIYRNTLNASVTYCLHMGHCGLCIASRLSQQSSQTHMCPQGLNILVRALLRQTAHSMLSSPPNTPALSCDKELSGSETFGLHSKTASPRTDCIVGAIEWIAGATLSQVDVRLVSVTGRDLTDIFQRYTAQAAVKAQSPHPPPTKAQRIGKEGSAEAGSSFVMTGGSTIFAGGRSFCAQNGVSESSNSEILSSPPWHHILIFSMTIHYNPYTDM